MKSGKLKLGRSRIVVNPNMRDYSNDPFFIKKAEKSKEMIMKVGLPGIPPEKLRASTEEAE
jgi:hypothetical protein